MTLSKWTKVQGGDGPAVVIYLCGDIDAALRAALPGVPIVRTGSSGNGATMGDLDAALRAAGSNELGALCGFSAGCQGVRSHLYSSVDPIAVVCADGTAGPWPLPSGAREVEVWRERARRPDRVTVLTATQQRYTQRLVKTASQPQGPFAATSTVLSRALDWTAIDDIRPLSPGEAVGFRYPGPPAAELHRDGLHAFLYRGTDCDASAHSAQLVHVLPEMLRRYVGPALGRPGSLSDIVAAFAGVRDAFVAMTRAIADATGWGGMTLGERCLVVARAELAAKVRETPGPTATPRIREYLSLCRRGGTPRAGMPGRENEGSSTLGATPSDETPWCAASASMCCLMALQPGEDAPHGYRAAVAELAADARVLGRLKLKGEGYQPKLGDLVISARSGGDPLKGGSGHVERVSSVSPLVTIGGNELGDTWVEAPHAGEADASFRAWIEVN